MDKSSCNQLSISVLKSLGQMGTNGASNVQLMVSQSGIQESTAVKEELRSIFQRIRLIIGDQAFEELAASHSANYL